MTIRRSMHMGIEEKLQRSIEVVLGDFVRAGTLAADPVKGVSFAIERPKRPEHGDLATNVAMKLAKGPKARELALSIGDKLRASGAVVTAEVAGPGFLNVRVAPAAYQDIPREILAAGADSRPAPAGTGARGLPGIR